MQKPSKIEIWRSEDIYSLNARPLIDKDDDASIIPDHVGKRCYVFIIFPH